MTERRVYGCSVCVHRGPLTKDGKLYRHGHRKEPKLLACAGSGRLPHPHYTASLPWAPACRCLGERATENVG